jgi:pimeloyl-ACP methyl ester carboxylesterase
MKIVETVFDSGSSFCFILLLWRKWEHKCTYLTDIGNKVTLARVSKSNMNLTEILIVVPASLLVLVVISFLVEMLRPQPQPPEKLVWGPGIPIRYVDIAGVKIRYINTGAGENLVLLHTLRTQLDLFEKVVPDLAKYFTVYALDYPGHGYSDIPNAKYDADFFVHYVEGFLAGLDLQDVTLCGVSIGGAISLIVAGRRNTRVARVIAMNPYDYARGRGMTRSSLLGWMITVTSETPLIGGTVMRLRNLVIMKAVLQGGVANPRSIRPALLKEMYVVGNRRGHYRAFISLLRHAASWEAATRVYGNINVPVCLIWGDKDWSKPNEREKDRSMIPGVQMTTVEHGGHFLPLDQPQELRERIIRFAGSRAPRA